MPVAHFAHEDAPAFFQYFRINDSRSVPKISNLMFTTQNRSGCFAVTIRAQRGRFPGNTQFQGSSLSRLEQRSRSPLWCGQDPLSYCAVNRLKNFPAYIGDGIKSVNLRRKHWNTSLTYPHGR